MSISIFPHCDQKVLHSPGTCEYCDMHPEWQDLRMAWNIAFTNEDDYTKIQCPSLWERDRRDIDAWDGNRAKK